MAEVKEELEALEGIGEAPKDVADLEALTIAMSQKVGKRTWEEWMKAHAKKAHFPPEYPYCKQAMRKAGLHYKVVHSIWGKVKMPKQSYYCRACFYYQRQFVEP